jgi:hypothetical protein
MPWGGANVTLEENLGTVDDEDVIELLAVA